MKMKYKELLQVKLERLENILTSIDSLTNIGAPKQEVRNLIVVAKTLADEVKSLIQKEN